MKCFKAYFDFDNGAIVVPLTKMVFADILYNDEKSIKESVERRLGMNLFDSNDCSIANLKVVEFELYDGLVV